MSASRRKSPQRELRQRELRHTLCQRVALLWETGAHPDPPLALPAEAMCVLQLQPCLPRAAKPRFAKFSAEPGFAAAAASVGSAGVGRACLGDRGTRAGPAGRHWGCPLSKAGAEALAELCFGDSCLSVK